jgi:hypothetical protein
MPQFNNSSARIAVDRTDAVEIDHALILALRQEAARRGTTVPRLIHDLLNAIAEDKLTAAILDK